MSKYLITLLVVVLIAGIVPPVQAQDDISEIPTPAACTPEEKQELLDLAVDITERFAEATGLVVPETADDYLALALAINEVRMYVESSDFDLPFCADSYIFGPIMEFWMDNYILLMQQSALYFYATEAGESAEFTDALMEYGTFHVERANDYQEQLTQIVSAMSGEDPLLSEWFPVCTEEDYADDVYTQLVDLENSINEQITVLNAFFASDPMDNSLLFFMEDWLMSWETVVEEMPMCSEIYWRELFTGIVSYQTSIALHWAALLDYVQGEANAMVMDALRDANEDAAEDWETWHVLVGEEVAAQ